MKNTGTLRIQAFAARQSSPVEGDVDQDEYGFLRLL